MSPIFAPCYLAPVSYWMEVVKNPCVIIDQYEHFEKQSYRNRCIIYGANGSQALIIPIEHGKGEHQQMREVKISINEDWQRLHLRSLQSAYRCSPFFEFYEDAFTPFYEKKWVYLMEYNIGLMELVAKLLKIDLQISLTDSYKKEYDSATYTDFRSLIHPKKTSTHTFRF